SSSLHRDLHSFPTRRSSDLVAMGFGTTSDEMDYPTMRGHILDEAKKMFRPEFLNRLDDIVVFRSLTKPDLIQILDLEIEKLSQRDRKSTRLNSSHVAISYAV